MPATDQRPFVLTGDRTTGLIGDVISIAQLLRADLRPIARRVVKWRLIL